MPTPSDRPQSVSSQHKGYSSLGTSSPSLLPKNKLTKRNSVTVRNLDDYGALFMKKPSGGDEDVLPSSAYDYESRLVP